MLKLAVIGLDTSHTIEFTRIIQGEVPQTSNGIEGLQITKCMRFESPFQAEDKQDRRQAQLEKWGVKVTDSFNDAVEGADGLLLEVNDPAQHLKYFKLATETGLPFFLEKPLAGNLDDGRKILEIAEANSTKAWSSSSLRFTDEIETCKKNMTSPTIANVFGPLGKAPVGSGLIWYGVHTFEMLSAIMGCDAKSVSAHEDDNGVVVVVNYRDGRRAVVECNSTSRFYGARVQKDTAIDSFYVKSVNKLYFNLIYKIRDFFLHGRIPVTLRESMEILALMVATEKSLASGKHEKVEL